MPNVYLAPQYGQCYGSSKSIFLINFSPMYALLICILINFLKVAYLFKSLRLGIMSNFLFYFVKSTTLSIKIMKIGAIY